MHITHIVESLHVGGLERVVLDLISEQLKRGHQCSVIYLSEPGTLSSEIDALKIQQFCCGKTIGFDLITVLRLKRFINQLSPNVVHSHNVMVNYYIAFAKLAGAKRFRLINTRHGIGRQIEDIRSARLFGFSLWFTFRAVGVCNASRDQMRSKYTRFIKRIITINNGIKIDLFKKRNQLDHQALAKKLNTGNSKQFIGIVARLNEIKNHRLLFKAFSTLTTKRKNIELVVIGDGVLRKELELYAQKLGIDGIVHFLGDRRDIPELLAGLDLFVLSSVKEGYSISLLEACAAALPIVATDVGGNCKIVHHAKNGFLVPSENAEALFYAMDSILSDNERLTLMGQESRKWVQKYGAAEVMADQYEQLYTLSS